MTRRAAGASAAVAYAALGAGVLALLLVWERRAYVDYSDGVYAATARELLHGAGLYSDVAAAQPPLVYLAGRVVLGVHDSVVALRIGLSVAALATGGLVTACVLRLTGRGTLAVAAGVLSLVPPWQLREHAALLPETPAAPLLLGAALVASRSRRGALAAGALGGVAAFLKLAFLLPAAAVVLIAPRRARGAAALVATLVVGAAATLLAYGAGDVWRGVVEAQVQSGTAPFGDVARAWTQAAWTALPLAVLAALALRRRARLRDPALARTLAALALAALVLLLTMVKRGTFLQSLVLFEPPAVALAAAGAWAWTRELGPVRAPVAALAALALALAGVQSASLLIDPTDPTAFAHPGSKADFGWELSSDGVDSAVARARRCPARVAFAGPPYLAFAAGRRMPGGQPDLFILGRRANERFARAAAADGRRCP